jgi:capsular exopolysaccharide synthesis family protein
VQDQRISTVLWRGKWLVLAAAVVGVVLAVVVTKSTAKVYEANAVIQVNAGATAAPGQGLNDVQLANQVLASTDATLITTKSFLQQVRSRVLDGELSASDLQSDTSATAVTNTALVSVTCKNSSPERAQRLCSDLATAFVQQISSQAQARSAEQQAQLQLRIRGLTRQIGAAKSPADADALRGARTQLQSQLADVVASGIQQGQSASVPAPPIASSAPVSPRPTLNLIAGLLLGLLVGVGLAWGRSRLDRGLHGAAEAEEILDVPVLGTVPVRRAFSTDDPVLGEAFDVLRANLAFLGVDRALQVLTLTSFNSGEGKSSTSEGLAFAAARSGVGVVVVDADVRTRKLSSRLELDGAPGLTSVLVGAASLDDVLVEVAPGVLLLPSGPTPPNPPSLLGSEAMRVLVEELRARFSLVLLDSPPVAHLADATILASVSDGVLVVARVGVTARADLLAASANLRHSPVPIVGSVVLDRQTIDETYYPAIAKGAQAPPVEPAETI